MGPGRSDCNPDQGDCSRIRPGDYPCAADAESNTRKAMYLQINDQVIAPECAEITHFFGHIDDQTGSDMCFGAFCFMHLIKHFRIEQFAQIHHTETDIAAVLSRENLADCYLVNQTDSLSDPETVRRLCGLISGDAFPCALHSRFNAEF